jgi:hypothetical protein
MRVNALGVAEPDVRRVVVPPTAYVVAASGREPAVVLPDDGDPLVPWVLPAIALVATPVLALNLFYVAALA